MTKIILNKEQIYEFQQNREPYLMIDFATEIIPGKSANGYKDLNDDESLILSGLLDSLAVIHIVVFLEKTFNINFAEVYFDQTSFDSVNQILRFIEENQPVNHRSLP